MSRLGLIAAVIVAGALATSACRRVKDPAPDAAPTADAAPATDVIEAAEAAAPAAGPAASGAASQEERRKELVALLSGTSDARALPEAATDPGQGFDRGLRKRLTTIEVPTNARHADVQLAASTMTVPIANADRVVAGMRGRFRFCYERALVEAPSLAGKLVLVTNVEKDGTVSNATTTANAGLSPAVTDCVIAVARRVQFDAPASPSVVKTPITFAQIKE